MYITNPTEDQLKEWYGCNLKVARYFVMKLPIIYIDRENGMHYFVKTDEWKHLHDKLPMRIKILEWMNK